MTTAQKVVSAMVLVIVVGGAFLLYGRGAPSEEAAPVVVGTDMQSVNHFERGLWWIGQGLYVGLLQQFGIDSAGNLLTSGSIAAGSGNGAIIQGSQASCANSASSTLFAVLPPSSATSTVTLTSMQVGGNATTSSLVIGTSTTPSPTAATGVSASLVNSSNGISTSSVQWTASGNNQVSGLGFIAPGAGTTYRILVKPGEYVVGFSTTTAIAGGATAYSPGFTTCNYTLEWHR